MLQHIGGGEVAGEEALRYQIHQAGPGAAKLGLGRGQQRKLVLKQRLIPRSPIARFTDARK